MVPNLANKRAKFRYNKVLNVGLELFLEKGYNDTSLNDIVERSGGSLSTIYKYFHNKEGLFKAIIANGINRFSDELEKNINLNDSLLLEEFLYKFGHSYFISIFSSKSIAFFKLVLSECFNRDTIAIGRDFVRDIDTFMSGRLTEFFKNDPDMMKFSSDELMNYASFFTYLAREPYFTNALFYGIEPNLTDNQLENHLKNIIKIFLYGILK
ncbi:TetR/AcrR family transcriptional regulator [Campylobacter corcagiensis]|uniref:TetR/AcrR family transcriptional regulator n=1 Tax=Campylobacter corcagiensis TaxID=1448857 RepID=A0A7M1LHN0_9BACT|nr:TetR/AcrR family transcriptional regulator [Campylobacter corcagiensis]QKF63967.1 multidrug efflux system CmeABC transcriptional regulator, TetR family [Campylobacter corcagiensis]QOQ87831.1 TetR/AcrR family transcriptional regulator [Campylobacter corcagiensis]